MTLRADIQAALETIPEVVAGDWSVHGGPVDAVSPPAYMLVWPEPWLTPMTFTVEMSRLDVVCIAARIEPDPGIVTLENMIEAATAVLGMSPVGGPGPFEIGGVRYLAARFNVSQPVPIGA